MPERRTTSYGQAIKSNWSGLQMLSEIDVAEIRERYSGLLNFSSEDIFEPIDPVSYKNAEGDTLLHIAAFAGDERTVSRLLAAGCDPNAVGDMGDTALHYAARRGHTGVVALLKQHGARDDIPNEFGSVPNV
jgi:ankyrin repeat protein